MPLNEKKIIAMILAQCDHIEERCPGYRKEILEVVSEILLLERQHRTQGTNIQQKIGDRCNVAGQILADRRAQSAN